MGEGLSLISKPEQPGGYGVSVDEQTSPSLFPGESDGAMQSPCLNVQVDGLSGVKKEARHGKSWRWRNELEVEKGQIHCQGTHASDGCERSRDT